MEVTTFFDALEAIFPSNLREILILIAGLFGVTVAVPVVRALNEALTEAIRGLVRRQFISFGELSTNFDELERQIGEDVLEGSTEKTIRDHLREIRNSIRELDENEEQQQLDLLTSGWKRVFELSRERLLNETERLQTRSQANLIFGVSTSFFGIILLVFLLFVFPPEVSEVSWIGVTASYGPRLTLVLIIQLMSTFFFRMYVSNENDIKLNKNEITNLEMRIVAVFMVDGSKTSAAKLAILLVGEERNFIIKKGERAVGEASGDVAGLSNSLSNFVAAVKTGQGK